MHQAPSIQRPRDVFDYHGHHMGETSGFRPDPGSGGLGVELELDEEARELLDTRLTRIWLTSDQVQAVRRDRIVLDMSLRELRLRLREQEMWRDLEWADIDPFDPADAGT